MRDRRTVESALPTTIPTDMEKDTEEEDEYVLLDLEEVFQGAGLPADCPYILSGLDTMNPILTLGDGDLKLIGEYEDTVGTCLIFTEHVEGASEGEVHPTEGNTSMEPKKCSTKKIKSLCKLEKKLKFRIMESKNQEA